MTLKCQSGNANLQIKIINTIAEFAALKSEWRYLVKQNPMTTFFQSWEWCFTWWRHFSTDKTLYIITVRDGRGQLVGIAPFYRIDRVGWLKERVSFHLIANEQVDSDFLDFIILPENQRPIYEKVLGHLNSLSWDFIQLDDLPEHSPTYTCLKQWSQEHRFSWYLLRREVCPYVNLDRSYEHYLNSLGRRTRRNIRNFERRLIRDFKASFEFLPVALHHLTTLFELHRRRQVVKRQFSPFLLPEIKTFHNALVAEFNSSEQVFFLEMRTSEQPLAILYLFDDGQRFYLYQGGYDPDVIPRTLNVTQVLIAKCIERAIQQRRQRFEMLRSENALKMGFTQTRQCNHTIFIGRTLFAQWIGGRRIINNHLRHQLKRLIPPGIRDRLKRIGQRQTLETISNG